MNFNAGGLGNPPYVLPFYKAFPFLNPEPVITQRGLRKELAGEYYTRLCDLRELRAKMEKQINKLIIKVNKNNK